MAVSGARWVARMLLAAAACLAWFVAAPAASAGTVQSNDNYLGFTAGAGEANHLFIFPGRGGFRVVDLGAPVTPGPGCSAVSANEVLCAVDLSAPPGHINVDAGDLDDFVSVSGDDVGVTVFGYEGNDSIEVDALCQGCHFVLANTVLDGGAGNDTLSTGRGGNLLIGNLGNDTLLSTRANSRNVLIGSEGADELEGGPGFDRAVYPTSNPVTADSDGVADDGEVGEGDNIAPAVEMIYGGSADDNLRASALKGSYGDDTLTVSEGEGLVFGGWGDDTIVGGPNGDTVYGEKGNDTIQGRAGNDYILGGPGNDTLRGEGGSDLIYGNEGRDVLFGGVGHDRLFGGLGNDTLQARDGLRDRLHGGPGTDRARIDRRLDVVMGIEALF
jgi:Ca2+-binding RTX toxin-like protein